MVNFKCEAKDCPQKNIEIHFIGNIKEAECGGCRSVLNSFDLQPDPEIPPSIFT
jgi:hypothetical protein